MLIGLSRHITPILALCLLTFATNTPAESPPPRPPTRMFGFGDVRLLAVSPDLRFLATGGRTGAFLWDLTSGQHLGSLDIPWTATALEFSPDGNTLFVASVRSVQAWNISTRTLTRSFEGHQGEINRIRVSPDGSTLASASADNTVRLWSVDQGLETTSIRVPGSPILDVSLAPDLRSFATLDTFLTNAVRIWDPASGALLRTLPLTNASPQRCVFSPDGDLLVVNPDRSLILWDPLNTRPKRTFPAVGEPTLYIVDAWFPNPDTLGAIGNDGRVFLWNLHTAELLRTIDGQPVLAALGVPGEHLVAGANLDSDVLVRQLPGGDTLRTFRGHTTSTHTGVAFSPDGSLVLSGGIEQAIRLWDRRTGNPVREFAGSPAGTASTGFFPDGRRVFATVGLPNPGIRTWHTDTGAIDRDYTWSSHWPTSVAVSHDGTVIAAGAQDQRVRLYDVAAGNLTRTLTVHGYPNRLAFSPAKPWVAVGSSSSTLAVFDFHTGAPVHELVPDTSAVTGLEFSRDGTVLLIAWDHGQVRILDTTTWTPRNEWRVPAGFLDAAAFSPDATLVLTGESFPEFSATLWDTASGERVRQFRSHRWSAASVAFDPTVASILTGADAVREWSIAELTAHLRIQRTPAHWELTWARGILEQATHPLGPWETVPNAVSPWSTPLDPARPTALFRIRLNP